MENETRSSERKKKKITILNWNRANGRRRNRRPHQDFKIRNGRRCQQYWKSTTSHQDSVRAELSTILEIDGIASRFGTGRGVNEEIASRIGTRGEICDAAEERFPSKLASGYRYELCSERYSLSEERWWLRD